MHRVSTGYFNIEILLKIGYLIVPSQPFKSGKDLLIRIFYLKYIYAISKFKHHRTNSESYKR
jgi:hypothetical protein